MEYDSITIIYIPKTSFEFKGFGIVCSTYLKDSTWSIYNKNGNKFQEKIYKGGLLVDSVAFYKPTLTSYNKITDAEWTLLTDYLSANGHIGKEAIALKSKSGWDDDILGRRTNRNGTNDYGYLGFPGGCRSSKDDFYDIGFDGVWWSFSERITLDAWSRSLSSGHDYIGNYYYFKENGFSIRCLRG